MVRDLIVKRRGTDQICKKKTLYKKLDNENL